MEILMKNAFPSIYEEDINKIEEILGLNLTCERASSETFYIGSEKIEIPYRINYEPTILEIGTINKNQRRILLAYFTRHCDGYIRQCCLRELSSYTNLRDYELAYLILLLGEYVFEIIVDAFTTLKNADCILINSIIEQNRAMIKYQHSRMISYWSEYYRRKSIDSYYCIDWKDYIGSDIIRYFEMHGY